MATDINAAIDRIPAAPPRRATLVPAVLVLVLALVAAVAIALGRGSDRPGFPSDDSAAAGFARDMSFHHAQAVDMSLIVRDRTKDDRVRLLAYDIALGQQLQIGEMSGWLQIWGLPATGPNGAMAWMGHGGADHRGAGGDVPAMPGMATEAALQQLRAASGRAAELLFLTLMMAHHRGGVEMAEALLERGDEPIVRQLAQKMRDAQRAEIETMKAMIRERGARSPSERAPA